MNYKRSCRKPTSSGRRSRSRLSSLRTSCVRCGTNYARSSETTMHCRRNCQNRGQFSRNRKINYRLSKVSRSIERAMAQAVECKICLPN